MHLLTIVFTSATLFSSAAALADSSPPLVLHVDPLDPSGASMGFDAGSIAQHLQQNFSAAGLRGNWVTAECTFRTPGRTNLSDVGSSTAAGPSIDKAKSQIADLTAPRKQDQAALAEAQAQGKKPEADPKLKDQLAAARQQLEDAKSQVAALSTAQKSDQAALANADALKNQLDAVTADRDLLQRRFTDAAVVRDKYQQDLTAAQDSLATQIDVNHKLDRALNVSYADNSNLRTQVYTLQSQNTYLQGQVDKLSGPAARVAEMIERVTVAEGEARKAKVDLQSVKLVMPNCRDPDEEAVKLKQNALEEHSARQNDEMLIAELRHRLETTQAALNESKAKLASYTRAHWSTPATPDPDPPPAQ